MRALLVKRDAAMYSVAVSTSGDRMGE